MSNVTKKLIGMFVGCDDSVHKPEKKFSANIGGEGTKRQCRGFLNTVLKVF
jgi:hypothetical protein